MANVFDAVLYPGFPFQETHPDRLAAQATLLGMAPPSLESCRVLELGCGDGANLIPMAFGMPGSRCVGIDLAGRPIAIGQAMVKALGLTNVTLREMSIMEADLGMGEFDYIIAHGVYSWVPPEVQARLLRVCSENLAPNGVAYISYNVYPGGHFREMIRRMMLYHTRGIADPAERVGQGLAFIGGLVQSLKESDPHRQIIAPDLERMEKMMPQSLFHDDLAEFNTPVYFYEFIERAEQQGLQFLAETDFSTMHAGQAAGSETGTPPAVDDVINQEQLLDFRIFRKFRRTLLCRQGIKLDRAMRPERVKSLYVSSPARPESADPDVQSPKPETFRTQDGKISVSCNHPLTKAALLYLGSHWPERIYFDSLKSYAVAQLHGDHDNGSSPFFEEMFLKMYLGKLIEAHAYAPHFVPKASERPVASPLARYQLQDREVATNLQHESVHFDSVVRHFTLLMDGTRDRAALLRDMEKQLASGKVTVEENGQPVGDLARAREVLANGMDRNLEKLARLALLVA